MPVSFLSIAGFSQERRQTVVRFGKARLAGQQLAVLLMLRAGSVSSSRRTARNARRNDSRSLRGVAAGRYERLGSKSASFPGGEIRIGRAPKPLAYDTISSSRRSKILENPRILVRREDRHIDQVALIGGGGSAMRQRSADSRISPQTGDKRSAFSTNRSQTPGLWSRK